MTGKGRRSARTPSASVSTVEGEDSIPTRHVFPDNTDGEAGVNPPTHE